MRGARVRTLLLACVAAALLATPAEASLETIVQDDGVLLYSPPQQLREAAQRLKLLGVERVRITANWSVLTRDSSARTKPAFDARDPAAYEQVRWNAVDAAVRAVQEAGMKVMVDIGFWAPHWATSAPPGPRARTNVKSRDFADFAVAVARRYSGDFVVPGSAPGEPPPAPGEDYNAFAQLLGQLFGLPPPARTVPARPSPLPRVDVFALWNEPNHPGLMLPQWKRDNDTPASPSIYRRMIRAAYPAIKRVRSGTRLLIGNTSSVGGYRGRGAVAPLEFLRELACVDKRFRARRRGGCAHFRRIPGDGWAHHPYTRNQRPDTRSKRRLRDDVMLADLPRLARTLRALARRGRISRAGARIYLTEFGFETKRVGKRPVVSKADHARWLTWSEYLADRVPAVRSFAQFLLRDQPPAATIVSDSKARPRGEFSTGLLHANGTPKTAARSFRAGLFAQRRRNGRVLLYARLRLGHANQAVTLERRAGRGRWKTIARLNIAGQAAFKRTVRHRRRTMYRLTYPGELGSRQLGLAVRPVRARR